MSAFNYLCSSGHPPIMFTVEPCPVCTPSTPPLSLRDQCAIAALPITAPAQGMEDANNELIYAESIAVRAYRIADAMEAERQKRSAL